MHTYPCLSASFVCKDYEEVSREKFLGQRDQHEGVLLRASAYQVQKDPVMTVDAAPVREGAEEPDPVLDFSCS